MLTGAQETNYIYSNKPQDYYARQMGDGGLRGLWFKKRQAITRCLVERYWKRGLILDIGCGNCLWNSGTAPTIGLEICEAMLRHNMPKIPLFFPLIADINEGLPFKSDSVSMVVITEILEHFSNYRFIIEEISRILKDDGIVILSVPYSKFPGIWWLIFPIWCKYKGLKDGDDYYLNKCGHKVNFNARMIRNEFKKFDLLENINLNLLTFFSVFKKQRK